MFTYISFRPAESFVQRITIVAALLSVMLIAVRGVEVDIKAYAMAVGLGAFLVVLGLGYRVSGRDDRIGSTAICAGIFVMFTLATSLFNYLLMPHRGPTLDPALAEIDAILFGYHWPDFVAFAAGFPLINAAMRLAYLSTLPQIAILVAALGLTGHLREMRQMVVTVVIAGTATIVFWGCFPSLGPSALYDLPPEVVERAGLVVDPAYGREIVSLLHNGASRLSPDEIRGLIAFPSFHIVLALAATWYARTLRWVFPVFVAVNILVLPGVLVHGGHHVVDIPAGALTFVAALYLAQRLVSTTPAQDTPAPVRAPLTDEHAVAGGRLKL